jgi:hypothetical protein
VSHIERASDMTTKLGATVAATPWVCEVCNIAWWNENSAGVMAICAAIGAVISIAGFIVGRFSSNSASKKAEK